MTTRCVGANIVGCNAAQTESGGEHHRLATGKAKTNESLSDRMLITQPRMDRIRFARQQSCTQYRNCYTLGPSSFEEHAFALALHRTQLVVPLRARGHSLFVAVISCLAILTVFISLL